MIQMILASRVCSFSPAGYFMFFVKEGDKLAEYLVVYICGQSIGNAKMVLQRNVASVEDIRTLEKEIEAKCKQKAVVINIIKLKESK